MTAMQDVKKRVWKQVFVSVLVIAGTLLCYSVYTLWSSSVVLVGFWHPHHISDSHSIIPLGNGTDDALVPNLVHLVRFGNPVITFVELICIKAALLYIKPKKLYIHCDNAPKGRYWDEISNHSDIEVVYLERPRQVFGIAIDVVQHASDVARLQILMQLGGIYLDNDVFVCRSFDEFRHYTFTVGWPTKDALIGNQILISTKDAPFLLEYYDSYHKFDDSQWYYNAGQVPTDDILRKNPDIAHTVPDEVFGVSVGLIYTIFLQKTDWHKWHALHLLYRHRPYLTKDDPIKEHDPINIKKLDTTFGAMARSVLPYVSLYVMQDGRTYELKKQQLSYRTANYWREQ
ncbi:PREDICTED: uncharacterized protein LOC106813474 [Priapulus caudatus]|uniref:Uncharacterized protein LOC106813474 n=1 Tax=Priapulus caudatus TaxID=37621 RepID=A0ABM1ELM5_PRICU|nr:PREDICTED: uncharacterized protein LOC106813474 [Priapulus caudatus]XP_014673097.1 PREDICTED: uncharacterized protein LOC106813474 [Priapulus caudatus]